MKKADALLGESSAIVYALSVVVDVPWRVDVSDHGSPLLPLFIHAALTQIFRSRLQRYRTGIIKDLPTVFPTFEILSNINDRSA
jgi:hypothetical protein